MTRLAADSKICTQVRDREPARLGQHYEAFFFSHYIGFVPWHTCHFSVTDVLVSYQGNVLKSRSQKQSYNWEGFQAMWKTLDIPNPKILETYAPTQRCLL